VPYAALEQHAEHMGDLHKHSFSNTTFACLHSNKIVICRYRSLRCKHASCLKEAHILKPVGNDVRLHMLRQHSMNVVRAETDVSGKGRRSLWHTFDFAYKLYGWLAAHGTQEAVRASYVELIACLLEAVGELNNITAAGLQYMLSFVPHSTWMGNLIISFAKHVVLRAFFFRANLY
jgi:hypothetical protein